MFQEFIEILILSAVQGISEFLPISSSAHLILVSNFYDLKTGSLLIDISLHLGSLFAIIFYFRKDLLDLKNNKKLLQLILLGSIPLIIFGYLLHSTELIYLLRNLKVIAWTTLFFGIVLFFADQAYAEFCDDNYLELLSNYSNFLCLRTFSKAMGSAGVRLGYLAGPERLISEISKRRLPYLLNHFALAAGMVLLSDAEAQAQIRDRVSLVVQERQRVWEALSVRSQASYQVYSSYTNFLLIRWKKSEECLAVHRKLVAAGVLVRNVSRGPGLEGCLRVSIGTAKENDAFLAAIL